MRFSNSNYLKAFPREEKKTTKVVVKDQEQKTGSVIEEAEAAAADQESEPDPEPEETEV